MYFKVEEGVELVLKWCAWISVRFTESAASLQDFVWTVRHYIQRRHFRKLQLLSRNELKLADLTSGTQHGIEVYKGQLSKTIGVCFQFFFKK